MCEVVQISVLCTIICSLSSTASRQSDCTRKYEEIIQFPAALVGFQLFFASHWPIRSPLATCTWRLSSYPPAYINPMQSSQSANNRARDQRYKRSGLRDEVSYRLILKRHLNEKARYIRLARILASECARSAVRYLPRLKRAYISLTIVESDYTRCFSLKIGCKIHRWSIFVFPPGSCTRRGS